MQHGARNPHHTPARAGRTRGRRVAAAAVLVALATLSTPALAGTDGTWTNATTGGLWSNSANWSGGTIADGQDGTADFSTLNLTADNTVHLDSARTIGNLKFADATTASNNWVLDNNAVAANVLTLSTSTGAPTLTVTNQGAFITAQLAGTQGFTKAGAGTLVLSAANTGLSGTVSNTGGGSLRLTNAAALGSVTGVSITNAGVAGGTGTQLELQNNVTINNIPLSMTSTATGNFRAALRSSSGSNTWGGAITVGGDNGAQFYADGGNLTVNGDITSTGAFTPSVVLRGASSTGTVNGTISVGTAGLAKTDSGTWVLTHAGNTWGTTQVSVGTLRVTAAGAVPAATVLTMGQNDTNSSTFDVQADTTVGGIALSSTGGTKSITNASAIRRTFTVNNATARSYGTSTLAGIVTGNLNLTKSGAGTLTLGSANTYTGATTILAGTLAIGSAAERLPDATAMSLGGGTFATAGFNETVGTLAVTASSNIDLGAGASVLKFAASDAQSWTGTLTVDNWSGSTSGGGTDQLFVGVDTTGLTPAQLSQITFTGFAPGAQLLSSGEVVPAAVPEPATLSLAAAAATLLPLARRRRRRRPEHA